MNRDDRPHNADPYGNSNSKFFHPFPQRRYTVRCFIIKCFFFLNFLKGGIKERLQLGVNSAPWASHRQAAQITGCFETASLLVLLCKCESTLNVETFPITDWTGGWSVSMSVCVKHSHCMNWLIPHYASKGFKLSEYLECHIIYIYNSSHHSIGMYDFVQFRGRWFILKILEVI